MRSRFRTWVCSALVLLGACDTTEPTAPRVILKPHELCSDHPPEAIVTFADNFVTQFIVASEQLSHPLDLTCERAERIGGLVVTGASSLEGVQNLTGLLALGGGDGGIQDLEPLAQLKALTEIGLPRHRVSDLRPLAAMTQLRRINFSGNAIEHWPELVGHIFLWEIILREAELTTLQPLEDVPDLSFLDIANNAVNDFTPLRLPWAGRIGTLNLSGNGLTDLATLGHLRVDFLDISRNPVSALEPVREVVLAGLTADSTEVSDLRPLAGAHVLYLSINGTGIADLAGIEDLRSTLVTFSAFGNALADISPLAADTLLRRLDLADNSIEDIGPVAGLRHLESLTLARNALVDVGALEGLTGLENVDLSGNPDLITIAPLVRNPGFGGRRHVSGTWQYDWLDIRGTQVPCSEIAQLKAREVVVLHSHPPLTPNC